MEKLKPLVIGDLTAKVPIIQGGMGVGISLHSLAGAVAKAGGIGLISTAQIGFREPDFRQKPLEANLRAIGKELKKAREIAPGGILGFNIMVATHDYALYVKEAVKAGADIIVSGAGLPVDLPGLIEGFKTKIAPIVSTAKSANVICKLWDRKYKRVPDLVVIEGPLAGGHLGFSPEELADVGQIDYDTEIKNILAVKKQYEDKYQTQIPVFVAGGIFTNEDVRHALELGADGVQAASRFVATEECDASEAFKQAYVWADEEDIVIIKSPVGMPGRAVKNRFIEKMQQDPGGVNWCYNCLKACNPATAEYCISQALINAVEGNLDEGLIFCGQRTWEIREISTVHQVVEDLLAV